MMLLAIMPVKKYFIAIVIPDPLGIEIENVKRFLDKDFGLKGALRSPAHITLHRPFEWKEEKENQLTEKLSAFEFKDDFKLEIQNYSWFEPRVIYAQVKPSEQLKELHNQLKNYAKRELRLFNEVDDRRGFHPHITVAFRDLKKPQFYKLREVFKEKKIEGTFNYEGFSLLKLDKTWNQLKEFKSD